MTTVKVRFVWSTYRPDARQYKQQSMEVMPFVGKQSTQPEIEIELPVNLLANAEEFIKAPIEGKPEPTPILSIKACKYLVDEWEKVFSDEEISPDDFNPSLPLTVSDDNWGDEQPKTNSEKATEQSAEDDNWDETDKTENPEEQWDEKDEDWGKPA